MHGAHATNAAYSMTKRAPDSNPQVDCQKLGAGCSERTKTEECTKCADPNAILVLKKVCMCKGGYYNAGSSAAMDCKKETGVGSVSFFFLLSFFFVHNIAGSSEAMDCKKHTGVGSVPTCHARRDVV